MANKFIVARMYLYNFKSIEEASIQFDGQNLNVLDGPNGFGKTTIYDAIQLLLTGYVRRVKDNKIVSSQKGFNDHLLSKNQNIHTEIVIEFINRDNGNSLVLQRFLPAPSSLLASQKRPHEFSQYKLYKLESYRDTSNKIELTDEELNELFGMDDMADRFNLYQYIEQEESTYLFKTNEEQRMNLLSKLFNIEDEISQKVFFEKVKNKLLAHRRLVNQEVEDLNRNLKKDSYEGIADKAKITYKPLINSSTILNTPWDKSSIHPLDFDLRKKYMEELNILNLLIRNKEDFKAEIKNDIFNNLLNAENKLQAIIILGHFHERYVDLNSLVVKQNKLSSILTLLKNKEILTERIEWGFIFENTSLPFESRLIEQNIELIKSYKDSANHISSLVSQMINTREKLENDFIAYKNSEPNALDECPLCGDSKQSLEELTLQIRKKTEVLTRSLDDNSKIYEEKFKELYTNYILIIITQIEKWLEENSIDKHFFNQLEHLNDAVSDMNLAKEWFKDEGIDVDELINYEEKYVDNLDERVQKFKTLISQKRLTISEECKKYMPQFKDVYSNRLNSDWELLNQISEDSIMIKKEYLEYQYYLQGSEIFQKYVLKNDFLKQINEKIDLIDALVKKYTSNINAHRAKMLSDIEVPFYIYSGKIIQNHQRGIGVFIKEERKSPQTGEAELKAINFIPPVKTDHDIVHSFSSGQLSSTLIAFTLALNKVYGNSGIMTLLIDDPIQTMDEMNMASFVELLRNDFRDRQLIISTHEENISLYLRYKFLKYKLSVGNINVKQKLYTI